MSALSIPYTIANGQATDGNKVAANFTSVKTWADASVVEKTGATMTGDLVLAGAPSTSLMAATKAYVDSYLPPGFIMQYAASTAPSGWLLADGTAVLRSTYSALFAVIGTTFGAGDGSTTFNLPNLKGRVPVGRDAGQVEFDVLGEIGGAKTHTLGTTEIPSHAHDLTHGHTAAAGNADTNHTHDGSSLSTSTSDHAHTPFSGSELFLTTGATYSLDLFDGGSSFAIGVNSVTSTASHAHTISGSTGFQSATHAHAITVNNASGSTGNAGSGGAHNNLQPYIVLNYCIKT